MMSFPPWCQSGNAVRAELRSALFETALPNSVMTAIFLVLGFDIARGSADTVVWIALASGLLCAGSKLVLIMVYKRRRIGAVGTEQTKQRCARAFGLLSLGLAASLGLLGSRTFAGPMVFQMLATGLLFGYCSGLVAHTSIRPRLAASCLIVSTIPVALGAALQGDDAHHLLAGSLLCFMVAALQSIRHMHEAIRQQIVTRQAMADLAQVDPLTRLPNRLGLKMAFLGEVDRGQQIAIHCLDLDAFKPVNDRFGHATGDALLAAVGDRVRSELKAHDTVARVGGDEFVILQSGVRNQSEADLFARALVRRITAPYEINRHHIEIGVSLGFVTAGAGECGLDELVAAADAALYQAKQRGGGVGHAETSATTF